MGTRRRDFLKSGTLPAAASLAATVPAPPLDAVRLARKHALVRLGPTPDFFEGLLLGNGDIGVCLTIRPDALGLHLGKSDSWDIRVSEEHVEQMLPFREVLALWERASQEAKRQGKPDMTYLENRIDFFKRYSDAMQSSYRKPWPRPWPCGILWLHWDSRMIRVVRQHLDLATGIATIALEWDDLRGTVRPVSLTCFVSREAGHLVVSTDVPLPVLSAAYYPHWDAQALLPQPLLAGEGSTFRCFQEFPATAPKDGKPSAPSDKDRSFALEGRFTGQWNAEEQKPEARRMFLRAGSPQPLRLDLVLATTADNRDTAAYARSEVERLSTITAGALERTSSTHWAEFWSKSAVQFADTELEALWYRNQYFLACCLKPGKVAPGLFGNWTSTNIGTAWHGDYHMNYNTQQVWWGVFSSNHVEQHEPYTRLVENLMPMAEWNARVQFGLPGAYFPHSAYPVPSHVNPYPAPPWGYEICETPWTVQSLWWQYIYTRDLAYLKRVYPILRAAAEFLVAFVQHGDDGKYHIVPTVSPENWGCTVDFRLNKDCIIDLALTEFLLDAVMESAKILDLDHEKRSTWETVRRNLAPYPEVEGPFGRVWLDVLNAPAEWVYNVPVTLAPVFPAEQVGLDTGTDRLEIARRTAHTVRLEGGNDLVWQPLARARLGILDLGWFKREVEYCMTKLGVANDRTRQIGGRYTDRTQPSYMMAMGVWTENLSLPAVLNECLMQSYAGVIHLFPNTAKLGPARFDNLRAVGAFLVSASWDGRRVADVKIISEKGALVRVRSPWPQARVSVRPESGGTMETVVRDGILEFPTAPAGVYRIRPA